MGYKHKSSTSNAVRASLAAANFSQDHSDVEGSARICEIVGIYLGGRHAQGAWTSPAALSLMPHALRRSRVAGARDRVLRSMLCDLTLGLARSCTSYLR